MRVDAGGPALPVPPGPAPSLPRAGSRPDQLCCCHPGAHLRSGSLDGLCRHYHSVLPCTSGIHRLLPVWDITCNTQQLMRLLISQRCVMVCKRREACAGGISLWQRRGRRSLSDVETSSEEEEGVADLREHTDTEDKVFCHRLQPLMAAGTSPIHEGMTQTVIRPCIFKRACWRAHGRPVFSRRLEKQVSLSPFVLPVSH